MVVDEQGFIDEEASDETLYVTIDGRTVPMATANILTLEGVDVPQGVRAARVMEIERRYEDRYNAETMPAAAAVSAAPAVAEGTNVSEVSPACPLWREVYNMLFISWSVFISYVGLKAFLSFSFLFK